MKSTSATHLSDATLGALEACHDAAFGLISWSAALQSLADSLGAASCVIRTTSVPNPFARRHESFYGPDSTENFEFSKLWLERTSSTGDPRFSFRSRLSPGAHVIVEDEVISADVRARHAFYNEVARPGCRDWSATVFFRVAGHPWALPIFRDAKRGRFQETEKPRLAAIIPYLERAILTADRVVDAVASSTLGALDRMSSPAMIIDDRGIVLRLNSAVEAMLGHGLNVVGGRLHASDRGSQQAWKAAGLSERRIFCPCFGSNRVSRRTALAARERHPPRWACERHVRSGQGYYSLRGDCARHPTCTGAVAAGLRPYPGRGATGIVVGQRLRVDRGGCGLEYRARNRANAIARNFRKDRDTQASQNSQPVLPRFSTPYR